MEDELPLKDAEKQPTPPPPLLVQTPKPPHVVAFPLLSLQGVEQALADVHRAEHCEQFAVPSKSPQVVKVSLTVPHP